MIRLCIPSLEKHGTVAQIAVFRFSIVSVIGTDKLGVPSDIPYWVTHAIADTDFPGNVHELHNLAKRIGVTVRWIDQNTARHPGISKVPREKMRKYRLSIGNQGAGNVSNIETTKNSAHLEPMKHSPRAWGKVRAATAVVVFSHAAAAQASAPADVVSSGVAVTQKPANRTMPSDIVTPGASTAAEARNVTGGNVAELQQLIRGSALTEFRTSYNGSYGASLLFHGKETTYYIALFQQKNFWRVIKTQDPVRAEAIYADFVRQTVQLSDGEIRRARLQAQKAFTDRMIALSRDRATRLQADLSIARAQQAEVADRQKQTQAQMQSLDAQRAAAEAQLRALQQRIRELQRQAEAGLPEARPR